MSFIRLAFHFYVCLILMNNELYTQDSSWKGFQKDSI